MWSPFALPLFSPGPSTPARMAEGVNGHHAFHVVPVALNEAGPVTALCGARVSTTGIPAHAWGQVTDAHERYCPHCEALAQRNRLALGSRR